MDSQKQPLVSAMVSICDVEKFLDQRLGSLAAQTYQNLEVICVNNGSPAKLAASAQKDSRIMAINFTLSEMFSVPQFQFADVCSHLACVLRKYLTMGNIRSVENETDRIHPGDLYQRNDRSPSRRKWHTREFYDARYLKRDVAKWVANDWCLGR